MCIYDIINEHMNINEIKCKTSNQIFLETFHDNSMRFSAITLFNTAQYYSIKSRPLSMTFKPSLMTIFQDKLLTRTYCEEIGDYDVPNVLVKRTLVFRPDLSDINWTVIISLFFLIQRKYRKVPKFSDTRKLYCNLPKIQEKRPNLGVFREKDANGIANSEYPDQTAPLGAV